ncbi:MAG: hypothetical protein ABL956_15630 [Hyphomonadaceae bacterium]
MDIFSNQIAPVVYLNGAALFVAGLAVVRAHNLWTWRWPVMLTLTGWFALFGGLWRVAAPNAAQAPENVTTFAVLAAMTAIGGILSAIAYGPSVLSIQKPSDD